MDSKYATLEEVAEAMRGLPINWNRVSELSIVWKNVNVGGSDVGNIYHAYPDVRIRFAENKGEE